MLNAIISTIIFFLIVSILIFLRNKFDQFAKWLRLSEKLFVKNIPGFTFREDAVSKEADKIKTLQKIEDIDLDTLPVINRNGKFLSVVNGDRLIASLLIDVAQNINR